MGSVEPSGTDLPVTDATASIAEISEVASAVQTATAGTWSRKRSGGGIGTSPKYTNCLSLTPVKNRLKTLSPPPAR